MAFINVLAVNWQIYMTSPLETTSYVIASGDLRWIMPLATAGSDREFGL